MAHEPEEPGTEPIGTEQFTTDQSTHPVDSPQFEPSPAHDQPRTLPPAARKPPADDPKVPPPKKPAAAATTGTSLISNAILMIVGGALAAGGYALARVYSPPKPPGEVAGQPPADAVKPEDFKKLGDRVDHMAQDMDQAKKDIANRPDFAPQLKMQNDRLNELSQAVTQMSPQINSINQKLDTVSRVVDSNSSARVDSIDKRVEEMNKAVDALRSETAAIQRSGNGQAGTGRVNDPQVDGLALEQAVDLFKARKYTEAKDAFVKLQSIFPNDARIWYYSALSNGFSSGQWLGDTERMVKTGLDKEKAGQPAAAQIDSTFASLVPDTGKDWLASYRKRIGPH